MTITAGYQTIGSVAGLPLNWQDEQSGELARPIHFYLSGKQMTPEEVETVRAYLEYYIKAPCWDTATDGDEDLAKLLAGLRKTISRGPKSTFQIGIWISRCLDIGIDPL